MPIRIIWDSLRGSSRLQWAEPVVQEALVEREAVHRVGQAQQHLLARHHPQPGGEQARAAAALRVMRATQAMCNQQRMLFNDLPQVFHWV